MFWLKSSHIKAVVQVSEVLDGYSLYANMSISKTPILIEFEHDIDYKAGDRNSIKGSLELKWSGWQIKFQAGT